jgi:fructokinase
VALYGGIEAGGTKFVCAVGNGSGELVVERRLPTTTPAVTLRGVIDFFRSCGHAIAALGIAAFGPLDLDSSSPSYGSIVSTPKPSWSGVDLFGQLRSALGVPVTIDTDVNGAALAEQRWGAGAGYASLVYLTVGTGIGGGAVVETRLLHGLAHPEMGHFRVPHDRRRDPFKGICPYHGDCWEGLASGPAMARRWGTPAEELPAGHPAWALEAGYLAAGVATIIGLLSPERVILGGGVMRRAALLSLVRAGVLELLNGYPPQPGSRGSLDDYIVPPALGERAGVLGAIALAQGATGEAR